jgi:carbon-monoxide dehydrogenase large subunit
VANVVGQRVRRLEDPRFLLGRARYVDDLPAEDELYVTFVRSEFAHARITGIDVGEAGALPGVRVFTAGDLELPAYPPPPFIEIDPRMFRPPLASDRVRFVGDIVAAVLADTGAGAVDAAELVIVDYDPLPAVVDVHESVKDEVVIYDELGTNVCLRHPPESPDPHIFDDCEVVVSGRHESPRLLACPIEPRSTRARFGEDGRLTIHLSTQTPHQDKMVLAGHLGLEPDQVRVVAPDVGGGFGGKGVDVEDVLTAALARATGRSVRWTETRSEHMVAMHHGRAQWVEFEIGGSREGDVRALRLKILQDAGAYPSIGAFLPGLTAMMASGAYAIPKIEADVTAAVTNTTPIGPVRGAGRPEATQVLERAMDLFAADIGVDPAEVRRRNLIPSDADWPYATASGAQYDIGDYVGALERVLKAADYEDLRREQERRRASGASRQLGIGLSVYVEVTNGITETEFGAIEITGDGGAIVKTGSFSQGQGHETTFAQIVAEHTGLPLEKISVVKGDTDQVPRGTGTYASKSTQIGGVAAGQASEILVEKAKRLAAGELEASPDDMVLDVSAGRFHVAGAPEPGLSWSELAVSLHDAGRLAELAADSDFAAAQPTFPFGAHLAVVEVDTETGSVELVRIVAVDDAGTIINPLIVEGQVHGGLAAGIAQALYEEMRYDEDGNPQHANLVNYSFPAATELPAFELVEMATPTTINPLGAKGIGESATIGSTPAVHNAVIDALKPYGVRELQLPVNGERVWRAIQDGRRSP